MYLNNSFSSDKLGGLVLIIGENNTGKSNLLKALGCFSDQLDEFKKNCTPNYLGFSNAITSLKLCVEEKISKDKDNVHEANLIIEHDSVSFSLTPETEQLKSIGLMALNSLDPESAVRADFTNKLNRTNNEESLLKICNGILRIKEGLSELKTQLEQDLNKITDTWANYLADATIKKLRALVEKIGDENTTLNGMQKILEKFKQLHDEGVNAYNKDNYQKIKFPNYPTIDLGEPVLSSSYVDYEKIEDIFKDYPLEEPEEIQSFLHSKLAQVIYYKPTKSFGSKDLMIAPDNLTQSEFFNFLFRATDPNAFEEIKEAYEKAKNQSEGFLNQAARRYEKLINEKISKHFNQMYFQDKNENLWYEFDFKLDGQKVSLSLFKRNKKDELEEVLELDYQSEGFRWYFDLFFNLLCSPHLKPNSIVIMDEGGSNLSVPTRIEYRNFLKKLGKERGITFVVSTHDPFLVDVDHLDELRILSLDEDLRNVSIDHFSSVSLKDSDSLKRIKKALGVEKRHLFKSKSVFVEGISDYNYLSAFKLLYERENKTSLNMVFLPINGLGRDNLKEPDKPKMKEILKTLIEEEPNAMLLVDNDKRGQACEELNKELGSKLNLFKLSQCDDSFKNFKNIEDLFSENDAIKLDLKNKYSGSHTAYTSALKNDLLLNPSLVETGTKGNFYKLLEWLYLKMDADNKVDNKKA
ncbi:hypothetical protein KVC30_01910 [Helicobacter pylori]|nr:hypothetical protein KVC30_01910 [Helicobacter pylori]WQT60143.1 hypothetical protein E5D95_01920 [Helicobacter pylori]